MFFREPIMVFTHFYLLLLYDINRKKIMRHLRAFLLAIYAVVLLSCDKITETLSGTVWESGSYESYLKTIEFSSETGFIWTTFSGNKGSGVYEYEFPNVNVQWRDESGYYHADGFVDNTKLYLYDANNQKHKFLRTK